MNLNEILSLIFAKTFKRWKNIDESINRHGVKREDFYQMYAYLTKYEDSNVAILLYNC